VDFDVSVGAETRKLRAAVVLSLDGLLHLPLRVVVPLTDWKPRFAGCLWFVHIQTRSDNGLSKDSGADAFQVKSMSEIRFDRCLGVASATELDAIADAVAFVVGRP